MDVDWGEVKIFSLSKAFNMVSILSLSLAVLGPTGRDFSWNNYWLTRYEKVNRVQLPPSKAHLSVIAFDTQQELLWTGDETVRHHSLIPFIVMVVEDSDARK